MVLDGGEINPSLSHLIEILSNSTPEQVKAVFEEPVPLIIDEYSEFGVGVLLFLIGLELPYSGFRFRSIDVVNVIIISEITTFS